jgi:uncharacterized ferritin-like protein (DUF455 family)
MSKEYLSGVPVRGKFLRYDTAIILKRFYLAERAMLIGQAGWLPGMPGFQAKVTLPRFLWQDAQTANSLRDRVYELRFPSRILEVGADQVLVDLIHYAYSAPNAYAFITVLARVLKPALLDAYKQYLEYADEIGDGPTYRFLKLAISEKKEQIAQLEELIPTCKPDDEGSQLSHEWFNEFSSLFSEIGGISLDLPHPAAFTKKAAFRPSEVPNRGNQFYNVRFYWPDIVDSSFQYGDGRQLQLRSAVSHLNEIWAVETAGYILFVFAAELEWEFILDAARWVYDESRHSRMGYERLRSWGYEDNEMPLGTYIYDSCIGQDPIYRLGMLFYFESKNIGKKIERIKSFSEINDRVSQHDMDFDWADETIHTSYGKTWLSKALENRGEDPQNYAHIKNVCEQIVAKTLETVTEAEIDEIANIANRMITKTAEMGV